MIKRLLVGISVLVVAIAFGSALPQHAQASTSDFTISSFDADYYLSRNQQKTSEMRVSETIVANFPNFDQNHGLLRAIPETYQGHIVSLEIDGVTNEHGVAYNYSTSHQNDNLVLKIGDDNRYVHGQNTYKISYHMKNVVSFLSDHEELYWDVNGDQWAQPMGQVTARVHIPSELSSTLQDRQTCYAGSYGGHGQNCVIGRSNTDKETVVTTMASNVQPYSTVTFVLGFTKGTFVLGPEVAAAKHHQRMVLAFLAIAASLPPLLTLLIMYSRWRKLGRDPRGRGIIVAEYQPPKGFNVLSSGFILEERLPTKAVSATIIELATKRYLTISEIKDKKLLRTSTDYELELIRDCSDLADEQQQVVAAFFGDDAHVGNTVKLSALKNKLHSDVQKLDTFLGKTLVTKGYFVSEPAKARTKYIGRGVLLIFLGGILCFTGVLLAVGIGLIISGIIVMIFSSIMPARSASGVEIRDYLLGVKEFIKVVEKDRFKVLQSPEGAEKINIDINDPKQKVILFESLLPYAMLFGLEKEWAKQFEDIYPEAPDWYRGDYTTFRTAYLVSSISNISTANSAAFTAPASSSSSGFGGGGFSGGGGGGGGGGGW